MNLPHFYIFMWFCHLVDTVIYSLNGVANNTYNKSVVF